MATDDSNPIPDSAPQASPDLLSRVFQAVLGPVYGWSAKRAATSPATPVRPREQLARGVRMGVRAGLIGGVLLLGVQTTFSFLRLFTPTQPIRTAAIPKLEELLPPPPDLGSALRDEGDWSLAGLPVRMMLSSVDPKNLEAALTATADWPSPDGNADPEMEAMLLDITTERGWNTIQQGEAQWRVILSDSTKVAVRVTTIEGKPRVQGGRFASSDKSGNWQLWTVTWNERLRPDRVNDESGLPPVPGVRRALAERRDRQGAVVVQGVLVDTTLEELKAFWKQSGWQARSRVPEGLKNWLQALPVTDPAALAGAGVTSSEPRWESIARGDLPGMLYLYTPIDASTIDLTQDASVGQKSKARAVVWFVRGPSSEAQVVQPPSTKLIDGSIESSAVPAVSPPSASPGPPPQPVRGAR